MRMLAVLIAVFSWQGIAISGELTSLYRSPTTRQPPKGQALALAADRSGKQVNLSIHFEFKKLKPYEFRYGGVAPSGGEPLKLKPVSEPMRRGFFDVERGFEITCSRLHPGAVVKSSAGKIDLFVGLGRKVGSNVLHLPQSVAWSAGGKVIVTPATGSLDLSGMDEPWLLVWWGNESPGFPLSLGADLNQNVSYDHRRPYDFPLVILLQNQATELAVKEDRWTLSFGKTTGTVVLLPLSGQLPQAFNKTGETVAGPYWNPGPHPVYESSTVKWKTGLPESIIAEVRSWAGRMRRLPNAVEEEFRVLPDGIEITERFEYVEIGDAWKTPSRPWAILPPIFSLSKVNGELIEVQQQARDLRWLGGFGPLTVVDGSDTLTYRIKIPQLDRYLFEMDRPVAGRVPNSPKEKIVRKILNEEIEKILAAGKHLAPFRNNPNYPGANWHWGNPGETIVSLIWALPWLDDQRAEKLKAYIKSEYKAYDPLESSFAPLAEGVRREHHLWDPDGRIAKSRWAKKSDATPNPYNLYAAWLYVRDIAGKQAGHVLWPRVKEFFQQQLELEEFSWDAGESIRRIPSKQMRAQYSNLNARLASYLAYARFARLAGDDEAEQLGRCLLARGLVVKHAQAYYHHDLARTGLRRGLEPPWPPGMFTGDKDFRGFFLAGLAPGGLDFHRMFRGTDAPYAYFYDLTPEIGQFLYDYCHKPVKACVGYVNWWNPGIWSNKGDRVFPQGEYFIIEPWIPWVNFLAVATAVQAPPDELSHQLGETRAKLGDLYYIQRLALTLRAYSLAEE